MLNDLNCKNLKATEKINSKQKKNSIEPDETVTIGKTALWIIFLEPDCFL